MKWETVLGRTGYIRTTMALLPVYQLSEKEILLFDSGTHPHPELLEALGEKGLRVRAVLSTHLHIDHIANNQPLIEQHGAEIFAHPSEIAWAEEYYHGLGYSVSPLKMDEKCEKMGEMNIDGVKIGLIPTYGHSVGHMAYVTPDGVCCIGDSMMSLKLLEMAKMPYMEDVDRAIESMEVLRQTEYPYYIASHRGVIPHSGLDELVDENIKKELELYDLIRGLIREEMPINDAIQLYLKGAGIQRMGEAAVGYVVRTAEKRLLALARAGEFLVENEKIRPLK